MSKPVNKGNALEVVDAATARALFARRITAPVSEPDTVETVRSVVHDITERGDQALLEYTARFDGVQLTTDTLRVTEEEIASAGAGLSAPLRDAICLARERVERYHRHQLRDSWFYLDGDTLLGQKIAPIPSVGLYIPGGKAAYPSTLIMNAVPARLAGVQRIIVCSPPGPDGSLPEAVLYAARLCGINEVYRAGGAQAIAAMALGTGSMAPVDKITGPGNRYVTEAKRMLYGTVDIDMIAGPSELLVYADDSVPVEWVVADLFSQAEHDEDAQVVLVSEQQDVLDAVNRHIEAALVDHPRRTIISTSLSRNGKAVLVANGEEAWQIINLYAPEHLEILTRRDSGEILSQVHNAGAIFIGPWSPEPLGDYVAGPNHTLPTAGTARFSSPLGVDDFLKKSSIIRFSRDGFRDLAKQAAVFARAEGLEAHARSVTIREGDRT